jgi:hypothetical protein
MIERRPRPLDVYHDECMTRAAAEAEQARANDPAEEHRVALSEALGLGTGAPWDAIRERAAELAASVRVPDTSQTTEAEPSDPTECSGEEGFCPEHGFHRHSLKQPGDPLPDTSHTVREQLLAALDFSYCLGLGFETPEQLLAAYDASRTAMPAAAYRAAEARVRALHQPMERGPFTICAHCSGWDGKWRCLGVVTNYPCPTLRAMAEPPAADAEHVGGGANAEDCPACSGTNPPYPFLCPGPAVSGRTDNETRGCGCPSEDVSEHMFGSDSCTCIPFIRQDGETRYCGPTDTVDMIAGWEIGRDCPHHQPAVGGAQPKEA